MNHSMEELALLYQDYAEKMKAAASNRKFGEGFLGFGRKLSDEPHHMVFFEAAKNMIAEMAEDATGQEARDIIRFVFERPDVCGKVDASTYWMMMVVHGQVEALIPLLTGEDAKELYTWYDKKNPKRIRLPIQNDIVKALLNQC